MSAVTGWWRRRSLRARLTAAAVAVITLAIVAAAVLLTVRLRASLVDGVDETALDRAEAAAAAVADGDISSAALVDDDDQIVQVVTPAGAVLATSVPADGPLLLPPTGRSLDVHTQQGVALPGERDERFRVLSLPVRAPSGPVVVQVALPLDDVEESVAELRAALALGVPAVVVVLAALTWVLVGRALRPVEALRSQVAHIPGTALDRRLDVPVSGDELARLAETFNALLSRVEAATARQRQFVADAAHEIRSPLASLRTQLEVAHLHADDDQWRSGLPDLVHDAQRLSRLVDDLLRLARLDAAAPAAAECVDLDDIVLSTARRVRESTGVAVDTSAVSGARVLGDADALVRVVQNLLDNAVRHARDQVRVELTAAEHATLTVSDDGAGIPADKREHVFERFTRLDDARSRDAGGAGLGLAIVREVVTQHRGSVRVEDASPGARFVIELPSAP